MSCDTSAWTAHGRVESDVLFVFFFEVTATTDIDTYGHPLALHDALPISRLCGAGSRSGGGFGGHPAAPSESVVASPSVASVSAASLSLAPPSRSASAFSASASATAPPSDRKSTRLNSSH